MLIPSIDLMDGRVVQLEQGERLALASDDVDGWAERFSAFPLVQVIDLDAAMGRGTNDRIVRRLCQRLPCQVGGGVRTPDRASALLGAGARRIIVGSSLFDPDGVDVRAAERFAAAVPLDGLVAAVDSRGGRVVIHGWKTAVPVSATDAVRALEAYVGAFLYTHVETEGMLGGIDMNAVRAVAAATTRRLIAAGGIRSQAEVDALDHAGIDAVVGMAIYRGILTGTTGTTGTPGTTGTSPCC
jgi:phosphoribosylformimino-5-aminoimidazole carboxamide ribotide isomerase